MLKILFMLLLLFPLCFMKNMFWMVQNMLFLIMFVLIIYNYFTNYWVSISYFLGMDLLSYGMILLSFWISSLMLMASYSINKYNNYKKIIFIKYLTIIIIIIINF